MLSHVFGTPWTLSHQTPLSMEFSRQEYWSGLPFPLQGGLPDPGIKPVSLASPALAGESFATAPPGNHVKLIHVQVSKRQQFAMKSLLWVKISVLYIALRLFNDF